jgi:hypothetical protein
MIFADISNFHKTSDYLPIINSALLVHLHVIYLVLNNYIKSKVLNDMYSNYKVTTTLMEVTLISLMIVVARFLYYRIFSYYSLSIFLILCVIVQIIYDFLFQIVSKLINNRQTSFIILLKEIIGKSVLLILTVLLASNFAALSLNLNIISFIFALYLLPFAIIN